MPWRLAAVAVVLAALVQVVAGTQPPVIAPSEAVQYEGLRVTVRGVAQEAGPWSDGSRIVLAHDGHGLEVRYVGDATVSEGQWLEAEGRLVRIAGRLFLEAQHIRPAEPPLPERPAWSAVAHAPDAWAGRWIMLAGEVEDGRLHGQGADVTTGTGPWPTAGKVAATGVLAYAPSCLCHVLHAHAVVPWTP